MVKGLKEKAIIDEEELKVKVIHLSLKMIFAD